MTKPLVLVTADVKPIDGFNWHAVNSTYLHAVLQGSDSIPLILPSLGAELDIDAALDQVDGVLATGSRSNVNPAIYGQEPTEENGPYDPDRDATTLPLLKRAIERGIPVFAICRGMQELNVALGGTLLTEIQTISGRKDHRAPVSEHQDERFQIAHPVEVADGSCLEKVLGSEPFEVNSLHRQAVGDLGAGLVMEANAEDGTIEAMSVKDSRGYVLATQWHPEYWVSTDGPSQKLFSAFGDAVRAYREKRLGH
ncbi:gamma-glutamyl-gamma-aminobutyrate hydrolase family protein [uncultured Roseibium sp.]|uniref:gamma-glutamyl-gamma-aminobutyrate hydrolase family protein n=1 Tax=uncultured Roseibium sp. TaxID=1936171 RepID=UPI0026067E83|nr:gamma-glutamyl-gamma-aminobutyrate hydrolase family protein [uncultured Roseibium sp.]